MGAAMSIAAVTATQVFPAFLRAVRLYQCPSLRDVELILATRGIVISYESIREWGLHFGRLFANKLKRCRLRPGLCGIACERASVSRPGVRSGLTTRGMNPQRAISSLPRLRF